MNLFKDFPIGQRSMGSSMSCSLFDDQFRLRFRGVKK